MRTMRNAMVPLLGGVILVGVGLGLCAAYGRRADVAKSRNIIPGYAARMTQRHKQDIRTLQDLTESAREAERQGRGRRRSRSIARRRGWA
jgi:hypothetical protein